MQKIEIRIATKCKQCKNILCKEFVIGKVFFASIYLDIFYDSILFYLKKFFSSKINKNYKNCFQGTRNEWISLKLKCWHLLHIKCVRRLRSKKFKIETKKHCWHQGLLIEGKERTFFVYFASFSAKKPLRRKDTIIQELTVSNCWFRNEITFLFTFLFLFFPSISLSLSLPLSLSPCLFSPL